MSSTSENTSHKPIGTQRGSCHCGAVRFQVSLAADATAGRCNCSICSKSGVTGFIVQPDAFQLLSPEADLGSYGWGGKISTRYFCRHCGIHCFGRGYLEQIGGHYVSINANCLDEVEPTELKIIYWDGRHDNWQGGPRSTPWPTFA
jgi:hypothetical protein